jgi:mRNA-degrading endonuclease RelE of RelBE toxin-antitoxin system
VHRVDATPLAARALGRVPGLWRRARETLRGILQTAEHARLIGANVPSQTPLRLRIGNYALTYTLDTEQSCATILGVESAQSSAAGPSRSTPA